MNALLAEIRALREELLEVKQRLNVLELGEYATKAQLYRLAGRRFVDQLIADGKLIPEIIPGHKRPHFCSATFYLYADRLKRKNLYERKRGI